MSTRAEAMSLTIIIVEICVVLEEFRCQGVTAFLPNPLLVTTSDRVTSTIDSHVLHLKRGTGVRKDVITIGVDDADSVD